MGNKVLARVKKTIFFTQNREFNARISKKIDVK